MMSQCVFKSVLFNQGKHGDPYQPPSHSGGYTDLVPRRRPGGGLMKNINFGSSYQPPGHPGTGHMMLGTLSMV
jgi:hypothetical protein